MSEKDEHPSIKVTDRRHFEKTGAKRPTPERGAEESPASPSQTTSRSDPQPTSRSQGASAAGPAPAGHAPPGAGSAPQDGPGEGIEGRRGGRAPEDLADIASGLSSSFSLLVARLAQETEIYLGLVPYPGKETAEPDLEAARAMIDMLSMLQEKTRGNLDPEESHLIENLLYTYRLEFVRRRSGGGVR